MLDASNYFSILSLGGVTVVILTLGVIDTALTLDVSHHGLPIGNLKRGDMKLQGITYPVNHHIIARAKDAPNGFSCLNCEYWDKDAHSCGEESIIEVARNPDNLYHIGVIDDKAHPLYAGDCCDFFEKK